MTHPVWFPAHGRQGNATGWVASVSPGKDLLIMLGHVVGVYCFYVLVWFINSFTNDGSVLGVLMAITDEIPRSRITLTYRTQVNGTRADKALPFRLLVMGDFSKGTSVDRKKDLDQREIRNLDGKNLNQVIQNMGMTLNFSVPNRVDKKDPVDGSAPAPLQVNLKLDSMKSFSPVEVARQVPKINALLTLRKLLLELQGNLDNRKEFRQLVRQLAQSPEAVQKLKTELAAFKSMSLPKLAATNPQPPTT